MMLPIDSLRVTLFNEAGMEDELAEVRITDVGILLEGHLLPDCIGISWTELAHLLQHPFVQECIEEVELFETPGIG